MDPGADDLETECLVAHPFQELSLPVPLNDPLLQLPVPYFIKLYPYTRTKTGRLTADNLLSKWKRRKFNSSMLEEWSHPTTRSIQVVVKIYRTITRSWRLSVIKATTFPREAYQLGSLVLPECVPSVCRKYLLNHSHINHQLSDVRTLLFLLRKA